jgi:uncharacterized protein (TIGR02217 family)
MAFHAVRLPENIERGVRGGPMFNTLITTTETGHEVPTSRWAYPRQRWDVGYGLEYIDDPATAVATVRDFFYARQGRFHSFLYKDWSDNRAENVFIGDYNTFTGSFQLFKRYLSGGYEFIRPVFHPVTGSVAVLRVPGGPLSYTVSPTGFVAVTTLLQPGQSVYAVFDFDNRVRFDTDHLDLTLEMFNVGAIPSLPIIEIRE